MYFSIIFYHIDLSDMYMYKSHYDIVKNFSDLLTLEVSKAGESSRSAGLRPEGMAK